MPPANTAAKWTRRFLRILVVLFLFINLVLASHAWKFTHFYDDPALRLPQKQGLLSAASFILAGNRIPKRLNDSLPSATFKTFYLQTTDNLQLQGWRLYPAGTDSTAVHKGAILMFHGHGSCRSAILPEANRFLELGYRVYMIDFRAHGNSPGEQCTIGIKESADVNALYDYAIAQGEKNIILYGASMGAATITKAIHDYQLAPSKIILEMPFASLADATKGKLRIMGLPGFLGPELTFWGGVLNGVWAFNFKPYVYASEIKCPVLLQWGRKDPRVTEEETNAIYANITSSRQLAIYENSAHESLCAKEPEKWLANVREFLK